MKLPRFSLLTLMAVVVVVAIDGVAFRLIAARPVFLMDQVWFAAMMTLPMVNVLAVAAAMRSRRHGASRAFLVGFEIAGWAAVVASLVWRRAILNALELGVVAVIPPQWMNWVNESQNGLLVAYGVVFGTYLLVQCVAAVLMGLVVRTVVGRFATAASPPAEPAPSRMGIVPLAWLVMLVAIPVAAIEGYLRVKVDPRLRDPVIARLAAGSTAVVDFHKIVTPVVLSPPANSPLQALEGARVRVVSDTSPWMVETYAIATNPGESRILRDLRGVQVTLLEGPRKGETMALPHSVLRPLP